MRSGRKYAAEAAVLGVLVAPGPLLARHAPILRYDSAESGRATAVEALTARHLDAAGGSSDRVALRPRETPPPDVVYGRVVGGRAGRTWLQYWLLYADNPQDRGIVRTGRHEGDWEVVQVLLDRAKRPQIAAFSQHHWAQACGWNDIERRGAAPVVYVANGSHASYPRGGEHGRPWPDPDDEADGRGRAVRPKVIGISGHEPSWVRWPGRWGRSEAGIVPGEMDSPRVPAFQPRDPWADPDAFLTRARACTSRAPPLPAGVLVAAALIAAALGAVGGAALMRRRRPRRA